jgi:hypothetical protein
MKQGRQAAEDSMIKREQTLTIWQSKRLAKIKAVLRQLWTQGIYSLGFLFGPLDFVPVPVKREQMPFVREVRL